MEVSATNNVITPKYEFTNECRTRYGKLGGIELYRIRALKTIWGTNGRVIAKSGDLGGWISSEANLSQFDNCWIGKDVKVINDAVVCGNAIIDGNVIVDDYVVVCGNTNIRTTDNGKVLLRNTSIVSGNAQIIATTQLTICGNTIISGNTTIQGDIYYINDSIIRDNKTYSEVCGDDYVA